MPRDDENYIVEKVYTQLEDAWGDMDVYFLRHADRHSKIKLKIYSRDGVTTRITMEKI
mgnify:CR=1 FL=1|jgi:hypothetical protein|tara:strand:+ start:2351 stop:2524 length:174 start_codon:yes stop_codon:yes gene_type:complete